MTEFDTIWLAGLSGLVAGGTHVLMGPDHLAAVLPLAVGGHRKTQWIGVGWGLGHSAGVVLLGLLSVLSSVLVDLEHWSFAFERLVGAALVFLGIWTVARASSVLHPETTPLEHSADKKPGLSPSHSAFGFGVLHGAAGASHIVSILPALLLKPSSAVVYLAAFIAGSIAVMAGFAYLAGQTLGQRPDRRRWALQLSGVCAVVVGGVWIAQGF